MSGKYYVGTTDIVDLYGKEKTGINSSVLFQMSSYSYTGEDTKFVQAGKLTSLAGWGQAATGKFNSCPFATKASCPVPSLKTSGDHYIAVTGNTYSTTRYFKYNSSVGACQVSSDNSSYSTIGSGYTGIFVGLQGGGGGGGGSCFDNGLVAANAKGGGGGGGGAFIWAYLNLSAIPNGVVTVTVGGGGAAGDVSEGWASLDLTAAAGKAGGATTLSYGGTTYLTAGGGAGGSGASSGSSGVSGGSGGTTTIKSASWITVLNYYYGKGGGSSGSLKQYYAGITGSANFGSDGSSFASTDTLWMPCNSSSPLVYRSGSTWTSSYTSASGGKNYVHSDSAYLSGGGGAGASVMSQASTSSSTMYGYGAGGYGGSATTGSTAKGAAGKTGCVFYAT